MPGYHRRRQHNGLDAWPGYVDALSTLLMVTIFVLLVFVLAQGLLSVTLTSKDRALERLNQQIAQLTDMLSLEKGRAADLQNNVASLAHDLGDVTTARDRLSKQLAAAQAQLTQDSAQVATLTAQRDKLSAQLADSSVQSQSASSRLNDMQGQLTQQTSAASDAQTQLSTLQAKLAEAQEQLQQDQSQLAQATALLATAKTASDASDQKVTALQLQLADMETRAKAAEASLATATAQLAQDQAQITKQTDQVSAGDTALTKQKQETDAANAQLALLNQQMAALRAQLQAISTALQLQESQGRDKDAQIADLGRKLNLALAAKVQELQRYRSDFFGELRQVLQNQPNIKIVGDRFVFQSDVLFPSNSADLTPEGQTQIDKIGQAIKSIMTEIPANISWVLRVDGHADSVPITGGPFKDNWQLSASRAIAVVQLLILDGVPANHLAAAAFGDTQPIDPGNTPAALAKNRRIEFRLTDR
ncbi:peptidoglycan -binding protein [Acidisoma cellulosilytica]|uniref:Peptidoglycan -binding protein n=1 Tax=Acidisoma cellulosilyticum TaxID=2802395 RepID=A0A963YYB3_9PROT|nr:peptidoglycan -binding protein [Acidisoma cellulosilyticum]MCB8879071.1 peptidoglycan -binding protein [Acidisoma cellulosilyticum]